MKHLHKTRIRIEKFVYENGTNVALYNAEQSLRYQNFEKTVRKALMEQIANIAQDEGKLKLLISMAKVRSTTAEVLAQVASYIGADSLKSKIDLVAYLIWAGEQGGQAFLDKVGIDGIFGLKDEELVDYFENYSILVIDSVDDFTKQWIAAKIQEGKDEGLSPFEIQELLMEDGEAISAIRAERIVLTETAQAMGKIEVEAAIKNGIKEKIWRTSLDERVCDICGPMEGQTVGITGNFDGERKNADGSVAEFIGVLHPPAHVSCRCYIEEVIPEGWDTSEKVWLGE